MDGCSSPHKARSPPPAACESAALASAACQQSGAGCQAELRLPMRLRSCSLPPASQGPSEQRDELAELIESLENEGTSPPAQRFLIHKDSNCSSADKVVGRAAPEGHDHCDPELAAAMKVGPPSGLLWQ